MTLPGKSESLWIDTSTSSRFPQLSGNISVDVAIIGGGITGLTAAVLLKRAGKKVAVLELARIVMGETGHTTAHLTEAVDSRYKKLIDDFGKEGAKLVAVLLGNAYRLQGMVVAYRAGYGLKVCSFGLLHHVPGFLYMTVVYHQLHAANSRT